MGEGKRIGGLVYFADLLRHAGLRCVPLPLIERSYAATGAEVTLDVG